MKVQYVLTLQTLIPIQNQNTQMKHVTPAPNSHLRIRAIQQNEKHTQNMTSTNSRNLVLVGRGGVDLNNSLYFNVV